MDFTINVTQRNSPRRHISTAQEDLIHMTRLNKKLFKEQKRDNRTIKILSSIFFIEILALLSFGIYQIILESTNKKEDAPIDLIFYNGSYQDVNREFIINLFENYKNNFSIQYILNDPYYLLPNYYFVKNFVKKDETDKAIYDFKTNDCDNFSFIVFGNFLKYQLTFNLTRSFLFGIAYVENIETNYAHTFNIFIDDKKDIYCLESQTDVILPCNNTNYDIYRVIF